MKLTFLHLLKLVYIKQKMDLCIYYRYSSKQARSNIYHFLHSNKNLYNFKEAFNFH